MKLKPDESPGTIGKLMEAKNSRSSFKKTNRLPFNEVSMKTTGLNNSFLLVFVRKIGQGLLTLFRFTEADVCALLSAYGGHAFEVDRVQNNPPIAQKEVSGKLFATGQPQRIGAPSGPIPIGVHPDFTLTNWTTASPNQLSRPGKVAHQSQLRPHQI
jgi:hypothetical protein